MATECRGDSEETRSPIACGTREGLSHIGTIYFKVLNAVTVENLNTTYYS